MIISSVPTVFAFPVPAQGFDTPPYQYPRPHPGPGPVVPLNEGFVPISLGGSPVPSGCIG